MSFSQPEGETEREKLERIRASEIEEARAIQTAILPAEPVRADGIEFAYQFRPLAEVGGDFLDIFSLGKRSTAIYLGDVVGKGLAAAMFAALSVGALRGLHKTGSEPNVVLELLNRRLRMRIVKGRFCAVQYAVFDPATRELRYSNAGLPLPLHISSEGCQEIGGGGLPAGLFDGARYEQHSLRLAPGDAVLFATDGLTDAHNPRQEEFGLNRLKEVCARHARESPATLLGHVFAAVDEFTAGEPQLDDITAAVLKLSP